MLKLKIKINTNFQICYFFSERIVEGFFFQTLASLIVQNSYLVKNLVQEDKVKFEDVLRLPGRSTTTSGIPMHRVNLTALVERFVNPKF